MTTKKLIDILHEWQSDIDVSLSISYDIESTVKELKELKLAIIILNYSDNS